MANSASEQKQESNHGWSSPEAEKGFKFLVSAMAELTESKESGVAQGYIAAQNGCRELFEYYAMKLCGLYGAGRTGSQAELDFEQVVIVHSVCGNLHAAFRIHEPGHEDFKFTQDLERRLGNHLNQDGGKGVGWRKFPVESSEFKKLHAIFKSTPVFALIMFANLHREIIEHHLKCHPEQHTSPFNSQAHSVTRSQRMLRKTISRVHKRGQGGRLSMVSTVLLLSRLTACIKGDVSFNITTAKLLPSVFFKLQDYCSDGPFDFNQEEIQAMLSICEATVKPFEASEELKPAEPPIFTQTNLEPNLVHDMIGMALHTHYWAEDVLEMLEGVLWKDLPAQESASRRALFIQAMSVYDTLPKSIFLATFRLQLQASPLGGFDFSGKSPLHTTSEEVSLGCDALAMRVSVESGIAMGRGSSLLPCMSIGIGKLVGHLGDFMSMRANDGHIIRVLEEDIKTLAASREQEVTSYQKTISSLEAERSDLHISVESLKEALKIAKEENRKLQNQEVKEGEAVFNSLNLKISERDGELEAAKRRIRDLERESKKTETQGAKEIKKEQAKVAVAEEALDKTRGELMTTKADLEAVEASRATLETKLETFKEKQREFAQKAERIKKELNERKAADSTSRATQDMVNAMIMKAVRKAEDAKEKEFAERMAISNTQRDEDLKCKIEDVETKDTQIKRKDGELIRKGEELMAMERLLLDEAQSRQIAEEKLARLQSTVRDHFAQERKLAESRDNLQGMLD